MKMMTISNQVRMKQVLHQPLKSPSTNKPTLGPFTPQLLPNRFMDFNSTLVGTELLILAAGEKLQSGGPRQHRALEAVSSFFASLPPLGLQQSCRTCPQMVGGSGLTVARYP